jgi:hypothetical protein
MSLVTLLHCKKPGGGFLRKIITMKIPDERTVNVNSVRAILDENMINHKQLKVYIGLWENNCLTSEFKEFIFKFIHGQLYLNSARSRFDVTINPGCSFCTIRQRQ